MFPGGVPALCQAVRYGDASFEGGRGSSKAMDVMPSSSLAASRARDGYQQKSYYANTFEAQRKGHSGAAGSSRGIESKGGGKNRGAGPPDLPVSAEDEQVLGQISDQDLPVLVSRALLYNVASATRVPELEQQVEELSQRIKDLSTKYNTKMRQVRELEGFMNDSHSSSHQKQGRMQRALEGAAQLAEEQNGFAFELESKLGELTSQVKQKEETVTRLQKDLWALLHEVGEAPPSLRSADVGLDDVVSIVAGALRGKSFEKQQQQQSFGSGHNRTLFATSLGAADGDYNLGESKGDRGVGRVHGSSSMSPNPPSDVQNRIRNAAAEIGRMRE